MERDQTAPPTPHDVRVLYQGDQRFRSRQLAFICLFSAALSVVCGLSAAGRVAGP